MNTLATRSQEILNTLPATSFVFRLDTEGRYLGVRTPPDAARLWRPAEDHIGKTIEDILPPKLAKFRRLYFEEALATKEIQHYGYPHPITAGRWMACQILPILAVSGEVEEVVVEVYDIAAFARIGSPYIQR